MAVTMPQIHRTPKGARIDLKCLYVYPDGHANLVFADGTNWPLADELETVEWLITRLLQPMLKAVR